MDTKTAQRQLISLITQHLSESIPVTRILTYKPDKSGSVTGRFESLGRVFNFAFNGMDVKYKPAGNMDSDLFSEYYLGRFDAAPRGVRAIPKCTSKSYSCKGSKGVACITLTHHCKMANTAIGNERLNKIKGLAKMLASSGEDTTKLEASQAKIVEQRLALAAENRAKRQPKKIEKVVPKSVETVKSKRNKIDIKAMTASLKNLKDLKEPSASKIKDFKEFKKVALDAYAEELYSSNRSESLPIADLRKTLGSRVTHEQFNDWMMDLKREGSANLSEMSDKEIEKTSKAELKNLIYNKDLKTYFKTIESPDVIKEWRKRPRPLETTEKRKTKDGKQIMNAKDFENVALKAYDAVTEKNGNKIAGIYEIRRAIGDRVTRAQFNDWMAEMHRNNVLRLHGGGEKQPTEDQTRDSIYNGVLKIFYFNAERIGDPKKKLSEQQPSNLKEEIKEWNDFYEGKNTPKNLGEHKSILGMMDKFYTQVPKGKESHLTVRGANGKTQSALIYSTSKEKGLYIEYLATAPWNLVEGDPRSEKGAGAKAIVEAVKISQKNGHNGRITLESVSSAIPFYEHLGFKNVRKETRSDLGLYELSPENAQKLLKKYGQ